MTLVHSFTLGGTADTALGVELQSSYQEPILPETRDYTVEIPGRPGAVRFDSDLGPREFTLDLTMIEPTTAAGLQTVVRALAAVLLDGDGKPQDVSLVFVKEPDKTYTVRYSGNLPLARLIGGTHGEFTLPLVAADPFAYGSEVTTSDTITTSPGTMTVSNTGAQSTPCVITVTNNGSATINGFTISRTGV